MSYKEPEVADFDIMWRGALQPLIDALTDSEKEEDFGDNSNALDWSDTDETFLNCLESDNQSKGLSSSQDEESPLRRVKRRKKAIALRLESDSDDDGEDDVIAACITDSDSDIELVDEQWRPPKTPMSEQKIDSEPSENDDATHDIAMSDFDEMPDLTQFKLTNKPKKDEFKLPSLPLVRKMNGPVLRARTRNLLSQQSDQLSVKDKPHTDATSSKSHSDSTNRRLHSNRSRVPRTRVSATRLQITRNEENEENKISKSNDSRLGTHNSRLSTQFKSQNSRLSTRHKLLVTNQLGDQRRRRRCAPVSLEEELIGEGDLSNSDEEEYRQSAHGALIEREAQCGSSDGESDESDEDGELEQSFINDGTIMSQQLSQDTMHGIYLQSTVEGW